MGIADLLQRRKQEKATKNLQEGLDFLEKNKNRSEVIVTPSGLQYEVITLSENEEKPNASNSVTCHYEGYLLNGKVFDSSKKRGTPATFPLNKVIAGWTEGLQYMTLGSTFKFYIPAHLAYGDRQVGTDIAPNSTLIFEVTLLAIQ
jgi:FKBP-type peptidyl-prolyl cis-trans isomerase FklB